MMKLAQELALSSMANEVSASISSMFVPKYDGGKHQFAVELDSSPNRTFEVSFNRDIWRNYISNKWGQNFISLSEADPNFIQRLKYWIGFKLELQNLPDSSKYDNLAPNKLAKLAGEGDHIASYALSKRATERMSSPENFTTIDEAEVIRLKLGFKKQFSLMMKKHSALVRTFFGLIPSGKKWDDLLSEAKHNARDVFYRTIDEFINKSVVDQSGNKLVKLDPNNMKDKKRAKAISEQIESFQLRSKMRCHNLFYK